MLRSLADTQSVSLSRLFLRHTCFVHRSQSDKRSEGYVKREADIVPVKLNIRAIKILMSEVTQMSKRAVSCVDSNEGRVHS